MENLIFIKTGKEIKAAVQSRKVQLQERLAKRNAALDAFLQNAEKIRSYIVRGASEPFYGHGSREAPILVGTNEISSEEQQEIQQICARVHQIQQELHRLSLIETHLDDKQKMELDLDDLIAYGFSAEGIETAETS